MDAKKSLHAALLSAFQLDEGVTPATAKHAIAMTDILCAFAEVLRGPAPEVHGVELVADDTQALILAELRGLRRHLDAISQPFSQFVPIGSGINVSSTTRYTSKDDVPSGGVTRVTDSSDQS